MTGSSTGTLLGIFAKHWRPGAVKTRLAATLGNERAAAIHRLFVTTLAGRCSSLADERQLVISPASSQGHFRAVAGDSWRLACQCEGDLGARMHAFFEAALKTARHTVLIGSDSPDLPTSLVVQAFDALKDKQVVLGPASDGGYYLIGASYGVPPTFNGIAWSTNHVWEQTIDRLDKAGIAWHALPGWHDVDEEADLHALLDRLPQSTPNDPHLAILETELRRLLAAPRQPRP